MSRLLGWVITTLACCALAAAPSPKLNPISSPDGQLRLFLTIDPQGVPHYILDRHKKAIIEPSPLGLVAAEADLSQGLSLVKTDSPKLVRDRYELLHGKQESYRYEATSWKVYLENNQGVPLELEFQLSNQGLAFRYVLPDNGKRWHLKEERSSFALPNGTKAWIQPKAEAQTGWSQTQPSYEEDYRIGVPVEDLKDFQDQQAVRAIEAKDPVNVYPYQGWIFPALFQTDLGWVLLSETGVGPDFCASHLVQDQAGRAFRIGYPQAAEGARGGPVLPEASGPWTTPWRLIVVASDLAGIVESTLGTDLATPARYEPQAWMKPGHASWSWVILKDDSVNFETSKRFIDYAARMNWEYCLVDASWDTRIGDAKMRELATYAQDRGVGLILWYNSAGNWNTTPYTPKSRLLDPAMRRAEFAKLQALGIKGLKVDFFPGDGQSVMQYYHELLTDAADYGLTMNFHGTTLPRGWQRTYPNLMTMEAVKGMEFITFTQAHADHAPVHMTVLPFTRNVFDPMDFTPMALEPVPNIQKRTRDDFELALAVLYTSGIQHFATTDTGMARQPDFIQTLLRDLPVTWEESRFVDGFPGSHAVIARKSGKYWYVAGINGQDQPVTLDLSRARFLRGDGDLYTTAEDGVTFRKTEERLPTQILAHGGFLFVIRN